MRYLVTGSQMRAIDQDTIQNIGIPSLVLMERAAECVARKAEQLCDQKTLQILAICGVGNNGADEWQRPGCFIFMDLMCWWS